MATTMLRYIRSFTGVAKDRRAVTALEYGIIAAIVIVTGLASFSSVGTRLNTKVSAVKAAMT